jgi:hypothetical protein
MRVTLPKPSGVWYVDELDQKTSAVPVRRHSYQETRVGIVENKKLCRIAHRAHPLLFAPSHYPCYDDQRRYRVLYE